MIVVLIKSILSLLVIFVVVLSFIVISIFIIYILGIILGSIGLNTLSLKLKEFSRKWTQTLVNSFKVKRKLND